MTTFNARDLFGRADALKVSSISVQATKSSLERELKNAEQKKQETIQKIKSIESSMNLLTDALEVLKGIVDSLSRDRIQTLTDLVTYALRTIFFDRNYQLEISVEDKRNTKTSELYIIETFPDGSQTRAKLRDSVGGGVQAVVGFVLQVYYIKQFSLSPIIFCDESFSQMSDDYIDGLHTLINRLAVKDNFIVVLVSHDSRLLSLADIVYEVNKGKVKKTAERKPQDETVVQEDIQ